MILHSHPSDPADWTVLAAPPRLLALAAADAANIGQLAPRLAEVDGFRSVLELVLGGGIAGAPSFALLDGDSSVLRVVLRGDASVTVHWQDPDAAELTLSGVGMATWLERVVEGAVSVHLRVPGAQWTLDLPPEGALAAIAAPQAAPHAASEAEEPAPHETILVPPTAALPAPATTAPDLLAPEPEAYDFLFGDTIYRTQAGVDVHMPNPDPQRAGDHDGQTMLADDLGLRDRVPDATQLGAPAAPAPFLPAVPPPLPEETLAPPTFAPAPALAVAPVLQLERADGTRETLRQPIIIGRAPSASASTLPEPRLITIADDKDISRSHVRVAVEGDAVVVTDLASKNGTVVTLPGGTPRKLRAGEPTVVLPGTLIDLGGGTFFTVRED